MSGDGNDDSRGSLGYERLSWGASTKPTHFRPPHPDICDRRPALGSSASGLRMVFLAYSNRIASPAGSESGYSTERTSSRLSTYGFGGSESAPASDDESSLPNTDQPSIPSSKLELVPPASHEHEFGREINFWGCDEAVLPPVSVEIDYLRTLEGGNATTYRGKLFVSNGQPIHVAVKVIRVDPDVDALKYHERLNREVRIWHTLKHRNILPFLGVYDIGHDFPALISPFYNFGHIGRYLQNYPSVNRHKLVRDCASGLKYLHDNGIVHGDLKPKNILIDKDHVACICDFGISSILGVHGFTTSNRAGTIRYMAPELFVVSDKHNTGKQPIPRTSFASDVWAFGLVALGILTSVWTTLPPLFVASTREVLENLLRPTREQYHHGSDDFKISAEMWIELEMCWNSDPESRPTMITILDSCLVKGGEDEVVYRRQPDP